jgi:hypothetical protein
VGGRDLDPEKGDHEGDYAGWLPSSSQLAGERDDAVRKKDAGGRPKWAATGAGWNYAA